MKKIAPIFVVLIVLAQLAWLSVKYDTCARELAEAPRILVRGTPRGAGVSIVHTRTQLGGDDGFFGNSLWWDAEKWKSRVEAAKLDLTPREKPSEDALELIPGDRPKLAGFWKPGADGLWQLCRVAAPGSAEDCCRHGELYTPVMFNGHLAFEFCMSKTTAPAPLRYDCVEYDLESYSARRDLEAWAGKHPESPLVLEVAIRGKKRPPLVTQLYVGTRCDKTYADIKADTQGEADKEEDCTPPPPTEQQATEPEPTPAAEQEPPATPVEAPAPQEAAPTTHAAPAPAPEETVPAEPEVEKAG